MDFMHPAVALAALTMLTARLKSPTNRSVCARAGWLHRTVLFVRRKGGFMTCSKFRWLIAAIVSGGCFATASMETLAQDYPTRPIRLVVPYSPGGPSDIVGRL